jgi:hypothetical protein
MKRMFGWAPAMGLAGAAAAVAETERRRDRATERTERMEVIEGEARFCGPEAGRMWLRTCP